jgi:DNA-directed RNA polymerase subunit L
MELKTLEKKTDSLRLEVAGETHTLLNLLRENAWKTGAKQASYTIRHPYLSQPEMYIVASDPKKVLSSAAQTAVDQSQDFAAAFKRASKK